MDFFVSCVRIGDSEYNKILLNTRYIKKIHRHFRDRPDIVEDTDGEMYECIDEKPSEDGLVSATPSFEECLYPSLRVYGL